MPIITGKHGYGIVEPTLTPYMGTNTTNHPGGNCKDPIHTITTGNQQCLITPTLIQYHSETAKGEVRGQTIEDPIMTVDGSNRYGLVTSFYINIMIVDIKELETVSRIHYQRSRRGIITV